MFDLGGVLIDWNPRYLYRGLFDDEAEMERFLTEICTPEWNATFDGGRAFADGVAELVREHPEKADLIRAYHERWIEMLGGAFDDTLELVRELRERGVPVYALSNWSAETFTATRGLFPFLDELDGLVISGEVGVRKPEAAIFRHLVDRFGLDPLTTVFIDDWDRNIDAAARLGFIALRFEGAAQLRRQLETLGLVGNGIG